MNVRNASASEVFVSKSGQAQAGQLQSTVSGDWRAQLLDSRIIRIIKVWREAILKITGPLASPIL